MLAANATQRNKAATLVRQGTLDGHLQEIPQAQHIVPYSDAAFRNAAIEWLVSTDQVRTQDTHISQSNLSSVSRCKPSSTQASER